MKRMFMLMLLAAFLCGCGNTQSLETTAPQDTSGVVIPTEPAGFYTPASALETLTGGSVRKYRPEDASSYAFAMMGSDVLLFSGDTATTLTRLTGDNLYPVAQIQLDCMLFPEDAGFQISERGITYFDENKCAVVFLDNNLKEVNRVDVPAGIVGSPVLSSNRLKLYYGTSGEIRVLDLETGLDRLLKEISADFQTVEGILFADTVLQCRLTEEDTYTVFLSTETGTLLGEILYDGSVTGEGEYYYAQLPGGIMRELVYGIPGEPPRMLIPSDPFGSAWYLEAANGAVVSSFRGNISEFAYYDLETGRKSSEIEIPGDFQPWHVESDSAHGYIYMMGTPEGENQGVIYRWNLETSAHTDETVYTGPWYTPESPDAEGLAECEVLADAIAGKYGVDILIGFDAILVQPWDYEMEAEYQVPVIRKALEALERALAVYPEGFLTTVNEDIKISLVRSLRGSAESGSLDTANGIQFWNSDRAYVALVCGETLEATLYHELFHIVDNYILSTCDAYYDWELLNPAGFSYSFGYEISGDTAQYLEIENRAFIDSYSMSYPKEDRARIMEYASVPGNAQYFESEIMQRKLQVLCQGIREAFDLRQYPNALIWEQYLQEHW